MADTVARVGQWSGARASVRNRIMTFGNRFAPALAAAIFEHTVSKSLGGDPSTLHWMPPQSNLKACTVPLKESVLDDDVVSDDDVVTVVERTVDDPTGAAVTSLLGSVLGFGHIRKLPEHIQRFRRRLNRGHGTGVVSVRADNGALVSCVRRVARLPATMEQGPFTASVNSAPGPFAHRRPQTWTRGFGSGRDGAVYATTHRTLRSLHSDCARGVVLLEGVGGVFDRWVQFGYVAESIDAGCESCGVHFRSIGVWLGERFRLPLPSWLLPRSQWDEVSTNDGWTFDGKISLPEVLGGCCLMHYFGHFVPSLDVEAKVSDGRHALVAGGTGLLGRAVCERLARNGFTVSVLTRQCRPDELPVGALRAVWWEPTSDESQAFQWSALVDEHTVIINLSGENPGAHRWTKTVMDRIADSRLRSVEALRIGISLASKEHRRPVAVLQASATGVYSDAGNQTLTECDAAVEQPQRVDSERGVCAIGTQFRVHCCHRIEAAAADISQAVLPHMLPVVNLRIGMVLSARGGVLPHLLKANSFGVRCIGSGDQWIPWIHVQDAAGMIAALSEADHLQGTINVTAQQPVQHHSLMKAINDSRGSALPRLWSLPGEPFAAWVGPSASVILDSTRAVPLRWSNGEFEYSFEYRTVREALESWECRADD
ncbi:MAG: DUF4166 domain-containing protein [Chromatiales bacterium]|nr:DUF4166 domain-containing protein [Chromatiales bacterium]